MKQRENLSYTVYETVFDSGKVEYFAMTPAQLAGFKRRKGIKKTIITMRKVVAIAIQIKTI
jgi:hypothetical protein